MARRLTIRPAPRTFSLLEGCLRSPRPEVRAMAAQMLGENAWPLLDELSKEPGADHAAIFQARLLAGEDAAVDVFFAGDDFDPGWLTVVALTALYERLAQQLPLRTRPEANLIAARCGCLDVVPVARGPALSLVGGIEDEVRDEVDEQRALLAAIQILRAAILREARVDDVHRARAGAGLVHIPGSASLILRVDDEEPALLAAATVWAALVASDGTKRGHQARRALALRCVREIGEGQRARKLLAGKAYERLRWPETLGSLSLSDRVVVCGALVDEGCALSDALFEAVTQDAEGRAALIARLDRLTPLQQARLIGCVDLDEVSDFVVVHWAGDARFRDALFHNLPVGSAFWQEERLVPAFLQSLTAIPQAALQALARGAERSHSELRQILEGTVDAELGERAAALAAIAVDILVEADVAAAAAAVVDRLLVRVLPQLAREDDDLGAFATAAAVGDQRSLARLVSAQQRCPPQWLEGMRAAIDGIRERR